jgi:hypothetical protein
MPCWITVFDRVYRVIEILEHGDKIGFFEIVPDGNPELVRFAQRLQTGFIFGRRTAGTTHLENGEIDSKVTTPT